MDGRRLRRLQMEGWLTPILLFYSVRRNLHKKRPGVSYTLLALHTVLKYLIAVFIPHLLLCSVNCGFIATFLLQGFDASSLRLSSHPFSRKPFLTTASQMYVDLSRLLPYLHKYPLKSYYYYHMQNYCL